MDWSKKRQIRQKLVCCQVDWSKDRETYVSMLSCAGLEKRQIDMIDEYGSPLGHIKE